MKIVVASIFRNSSGYIDQYFKQVRMLADVLEDANHEVELLLVEGDSTDNSFALLESGLVAHGLQGKVLECSHGGQVFGSVDNAQRWRNISKVCNYLLMFLPKNDVVLYVESDLLWTPDTMLALLDDMNGYDAVAPMCFHLPTGKFYDTWGHRKDGVRFSQSSPYHAALNQVHPGERIEIDSAGSCIVMRAEVAALARFLPTELGIVGFCGDMRQWGFKLWLNPHQRVYHP